MKRGALVSSDPFPDTEFFSDNGKISRKHIRLGNITLPFHILRISLTAGTVFHTHWNKNYDHNKDKRHILVHYTLNTLAKLVALNQITMRVKYLSPFLLTWGFPPDVISSISEVLVETNKRSNCSVIVNQLKKCQIYSNTKT